LVRPQPLAASQPNRGTPCRDASRSVAFVGSRSPSPPYPGITVDGVAASDGEAESVELLLTVPRGAGKEKHVMRVRRVNRTTVERDLREQMQAEFAKR
jgi:hypothetical protein